MILETIIVLGILFIVVTGPSIVIFGLGKSVINALARNPSSANKIFWGVFIILIFVEALSVIAMLVLLQIFGK